MRRIVIVGGMGPQASVELHRQIIACAAKAGAKDNENYPEILHISIPVPDFIGSEDSSKSLKRLEQALNALKLYPEDLLILACNTVHLLLPNIERKYGIKFMSLVEATIEDIRKSGIKKIGLIASPTTIKTKLYGKSLEAIGCQVVLPTNKEIDKLESAIRLVIANNSTSKLKNMIKPIIERMERDGAEKIILGCTELSVIFKDTKTSNLVDPLKIVSSRLF